MALNIHSDDWLLDTNNLLIISNLKVGDIVKIANNLERFWVKIIELNENYVLGKIDNYLTFNKFYDYQDIVIFEKNNILDLHNKEITDVMDIHLKTNCLIKNIK